MDAEGDATPSPPPRLETLAMPTARKAESVASQFQREILGELAATPQPLSLSLSSRTTTSVTTTAATTTSTRDDIKISTPETFTARGGAVPTDSERLAHTQGAEQYDEEEKGGDSDGAGDLDDFARRHTLSPSKAALLVASAIDSNSNALDDSAISRRDTVSPQALKSLLQSISLDDASPSARRASRSPAQRFDVTFASPAAATPNRFLAAQPSSPPLSASASASVAPQTPESIRKTRAMTRDERTLSPSEAQSMTLSDFAPVQRPTTTATATVAVLESNSNGSSSTDSLPDDDDDDADSDRRTTLEPVDAADFVSALRDELHDDSSVTASNSIDSSSSSKSQRRQTLGAIEVAVAADASPAMRTRSRRATVDPRDMRATVSANKRPTRRETVDAHELHALQSELRAAPSTASSNSSDTDMHVDTSSEHTNTRKRSAADADGASDDAHASPKGNRTKKTRSSESPVASPPRDAVVSNASRQAAGLARPQKTPTPGKLPRGSSIDSDSAELTPRPRARALERQSLLAKFSSPPAVTTRSTKTPLRSILSAKKPAAPGATTTAASSATALSTPTKSVNFGPSQGAEFNTGSPSTSMTPMPAKDARRLFPLDRASLSPPSLLEADEDDEDDAETSLNTSLLDEADAIDSDDDTMELLVGARMSLAPDNSDGSSTNDATKSPTDKARRRYSLRGVSPMVNQANARRLRRSSVGHALTSSTTTRGSPVSAHKLRSIGPGALTTTVPSAPLAPPATTKATTSVFLSDPSEAESADVPTQLREAYADSSASSDASDDMEITGDFSAFVQTSGLLSASAQKAKAAMPEFRFRGSRAKDADADTHTELGMDANTLQGDSDTLQGDGDTVELGSLGDLVAESAAYDTSSNGSAATGSGSSSSDVLSAAIGAAAVRRFGSRHYSQLDEQDVTLDPILEEEEDAGNSSAPSMMSLDGASDDDDDDESDDAEYDERRKSLVVNLSSKFARVVSASPKPLSSSERSSGDVTAAELSARIQSPRRKSVAPPLDVPLISMDALLATAGVNEGATATTEPAGDYFRDLYAPSNDAVDATVDTIKRAAIATTCKDVVKWHADEVASWVTGVTDALAPLLREPAPALFSPAVLDAADRESVRALHTLETARVQSGLCQWRSKMESEVAAKLASAADALESDARMLRQRVANSEATRAGELAALQELIAREQQLAEMVDAIDEQQAVQSEYAANVDALETQCAALALEASVLSDQLRVAEAVASEGSVVSPEAAAELERQVLHVEEVSAIQSSLSLWRVAVATASHLKLSARLDDVLLTIELQVDVVLSDLTSSSSSSTSSGGGFSTDVAANVTLKRRRPSTHVADTDIVRLVQQKLFDPVQLSRFIRTATSAAQPSATAAADRPRRIRTLLHELERYTALSFRFLRELRALSAQYAVEYIPDGAVLWVEFLNFAPGRETKFVVGFALLDEFPFGNFETSVDVVYGPVSPNAIRAEIDAETAKQLDYEYISRICERLRNAFVVR